LVLNISANGYEQGVCFPEDYQLDYGVCVVIQWFTGMVIGAWCFVVAPICL